MSNEIKFKMNYKETTKQRNYTIADVADTAIGANTVRAKAKAFNEYLSTATVNPVFISEDGKPASEISNVQIITIEETPIEGV